MKFENEITVEVKMSKFDLISFIEENNYKKVDEYTVDDIYFVEENTDLNQNTLDILKKCILVRSIDEQKHYLVYKYKKYDKNENIIKQGKSKVQIFNKEEGEKFLQTVGYKKLIHIIDKIVVYEKNGLELCIEYVNDKYLYIEVEENEDYNTVEKMIMALEKTNIEYDRSNYFVKKAQVVFEENYQNN